MNKYSKYFLFAFFGIVMISCDDDALETSLEQAEREDEIIQKILTERGFTSANYKTTESGMYYYYINEDPASTVAEGDKLIEIDYSGKFPYGLTFDQGTIELQGFTGRILEDRDSCTALGNSGVISGWTEAIQILKVNEKARFFIPSALAYGSTGSSGIPGNATLEFDMEITSSKDTTGIICN